MVTTIISHLTQSARKWYIDGEWGTIGLSKHDILSNVGSYFKDVPVLVEFGETILQATRDPITNMF